MPSTSAEISLRGLRGNLETSNELHNQTMLGATSALAGEENIDEECGRSMIIRECVAHLTIAQVTSLGFRLRCLSSIIFVNLTLLYNSRYKNTDHHMQRANDCTQSPESQALISPRPSPEPHNATLVVSCNRGTSVADGACGADPHQRQRNPRIVAVHRHS